MLHNIDRTRRWAVVIDYSTYYDYIFVAFFYEDDAALVYNLYSGLAIFIFHRGPIGAYAAVDLPLLATRR